jgi:hypothetical protein
MIWPDHNTAVLNMTNSNLCDAYLPAKMWLRNDDIGRFRDKSRPSPFPKFNYSVAVPGKSYQQFARDDLAIFASSKRNKITLEEHSPPMERKSFVCIIDELFLPSEKESHENTKISPYTAGRPVQRHLNPSQRLPRTAKPINALPACLVAGPQSSSAFHTSPAGSKGLDQRPQTLGAPSRLSKEIYNSVISQDETSNSHNEGANLTPSIVRTGRRRSSAQTFDRVQFAQIPSHYGLHRQSDNQDIQTHTYLSPELPPVRVVSALRFSGIFPALATSSLASDGIPQSSRIGTHPRKDDHKNVEIRSKNAGALDDGVDLKSSGSQKGKQCCSTKSFDPVHFAQIPSHHGFSKQNTDQDLQEKKYLPPEIPPLRPVSSFRLSVIFPSSSSPSGSLDEISHSTQAVAHSPRRTSKIRAPRAEFPSSPNGSNDMAPSDLDTLPSQRSHLGVMPNISSHDAFHKQIRRQKGYENLRIASTSYTIPPLPASSPLSFPDFSSDMWLF